MNGTKGEKKMITAIRTLLALAAALLLAATPAAAQRDRPPADPPRPAHILAAADLRPGLDLGGAWHWSIDPYRDGVAGFHGEPAGRGHRRFEDVVVAEAEAADPHALFEYDMARSPLVDLPSSWITHDPTLRHYDGLVWYQRRFDAAPRPGRRAFLRFGAVDYAAAVYLNGELVGRHQGGFTPFAFEVTGRLRDGGNVVTVAADAERSAFTIPPPVTDWETYGGITRSVRLVEVPATYVDDAWVRLTRDGRLAVTVRLDGAAAAGAPVRLLIPALGFALDGRTGADGSWSAEAPAPTGLERWQPGRPTLYDVEIAAGEDVLRDRIGFRTVSVEGERILLNGRPVFLRGVSLHEEEIGAEPTRATTPASARALLTEARDGLHANFVRLAHYPHSEVMTRAADELGLLVWSEIPVYWRIAFDSPETLAAARLMLAENILRDRNRASIILWSVGNETPVSAPRTRFLARLAADVRAHDPSRLVTAALLNRREERDGRVEMVIDDPLVPDLDVMAVNTYNGWYSRDPLSALPGFVWRSDHAKPLILSEFGADALAGFRDPGRMPRYSEDYQAEYYRQTLAMADRIPFLAGLSPWILKDFRSPRRQHPVYQRGWNRKGLISETGVRKLAFAVLAEHYRRRAQGEGE
ncbi:glycoside hydrolase family 2 protein [Sphingosinicella terrae]|uniref:glycoside hydrolase family 2 protein n=1 Tax=Sphingosinicella terrae TaxID=2172047 RepID=UPI002546ED6F|nr:glycoside hydrolase family 2 TIM barrel-domain containing protein [Sphingosinicella terrae]